MGHPWYICTQVYAINIYLKRNLILVPVAGNTAAILTQMVKPFGQVPAGISWYSYSVSISNSCDEVLVAKETV